MLFGFLFLFLFIIGVVFNNNNIIIIFIHIYIKNLNYIINNKLIIKNLNLTLKKGNLIVIQGNNGTGKTTLFKILSNFTNSNLGLILLNKKIIIKNKVHFIFNNYFFNNKYIYIYKFIKYNLKIYINKILNIKILNIKNENIYSLSHGQFKFFLIIILLLKIIPIWLLDELLSLLDIKKQLILKKLIKNHRNDNGIIFITTHQNLKIKKIKSIKFF
jgi:heme exporter protein A